MGIKRTIYIFILGAAMLCQGCSQVQSDLEKVELTTLDGEQVNMNDLKGKIVFMNFWATWCKPCIQEMPTIAKAQQQLKSEDIVFIFPSEEDEDLILAFKEKKDFNFNYVRARNVSALNIQALPTTFIFNKNGERVFSEAGFRDWSTPENLALIRGN
ncbi:MAG: TlpA disulfide reductase family protein [Cyclobacteriaceae bacterium]